ncbi:MULTISPECIES: 1,2-phenylacetyl-CoA epoxidase subunit PaaC [Rhodobacterales]|jgi:ring-1,2-phenylacetyl-CoA epoxidase subunit PaaC|uniref:1,2-phenylacetyl-CoA epoxidase subunit PaaC n=1 Tax=Rhodobacterales TaxID=204455 RepID=UPI00237F3091|nr:1,2-phenylacetyl-CoA epoxidase subunit PaaC [Phaeobacter gallaeciensis]MDE4140374.1 phenylacetate-CoA oxygenase subunit PaaC [Phaeobacter gallaeciensis]MDE4148933.1 phenylacetate-CoA oxygenase subunit PaaC [Phaeobacter gallaeciensis]MDE4153155.1 phenylacetate-CoA oxygenase subunit PaaC [Phaeobacter gallaeciensis]MDE4228431.1 phenylacetate-CoA oxygenase subunit PaaC [Phaeobacter gallaeciensis]MDE4257507.1 phenylacetate-CoA oxygenase subunit PaaC [Phaeobacter gallaeciensis]
MTREEAFTQFLLRMGDNTLILGHRVSEWCGHAPVLEEDIALANTALDLIGQTQMWLGLAGEVQGEGKSADDLAFLRDVWDFRNVLLVEVPNGDFGRTLMRQCLFDAWHSIQLGHLMKSSDERVAAIAAKASKEVAYHLERSADTVVGLGDGTEESHRRMQEALDYLWPYVGEMFQSDDVDAEMVKAGIAPDPASLRDDFDALIGRIMGEATLTIPDSAFGHKGGRTGKMHTEHLGHLLTHMQWLQRAYPGAKW